MRPLVNWYVSRTARFGDAMLFIGRWCFHLSTDPDNGWDYTFGPRGFAIQVRLR